MKLIRKEFKTLTQAEKFQSRLYDKYFSVQLIQSPRFAEAGIYIFKVSNQFI